MMQVREHVRRTFNWTMYCFLVSGAAERRDNTVRLMAPNCEGVLLVSITVRFKLIELGPANTAVHKAIINKTRLRTGRKDLLAVLLVIFLFC